MADRKMVVALIISFIFTGLGIAYLGDLKKGLGFFAAAVVLNILGMWVSSIFSYIAILLWIVALYFTYQEAKLAAGE